MGKPRKASKRRNINKWARLGRQRWPKDAEAKGAFSEKGVCQADTEKNRVTEPHVAQLQEHHSRCVVRLHLLGLRSANVFYHANGALRVVSALREKLSGLTLNYGELYMLQLI